MGGIQVLGPARVDGNGDLSPRERTVLAALVLLIGHPVSPDELADAVWGDALPATWNKQVQSAVGRVRRAIGPAAIETTPAGYRLLVEPRTVDVTQFESEVSRARMFAATGEPGRAAMVFDRALNLWDGPAFADLASWEPGRSQAQRLEEVRRTVQEDLLEARLAFGDNRGVAADAESAVRAEPLRERRWAVLALAQYRDSRQADALATLRRARRVLADELGIDPGAALVELERQVLRQDPRAAGVGQHADARATCPWKGLAAYDAADQEDFFGREDEVTACLSRLDAMPVLVLTGESGCGKSSLLRAGLVAALRDAGRRVSVTVPGPSPVAGLQAALAGMGARDVLAVDQLESLFLLDQDREQVVQYCGLLRRHVQDGGALLLAVRVDQMSGLAADPALGALAERGLHLVAPLAGDDLQRAIEEPARLAGLALEHGLVDLLLRDVEADPGALPLLSHALVETWHRRDGDVLTVESYRASGGISAAVARTADRLYEGLPEDERSLCRSILLRLVAPSVDGPPVPRRVPASSLRGDVGRERVVADLVGARLLTAREDSIEMAHESLARAWPRLRSWIDDDAVGTRLLRHLVAATEAWEALGRPDSDLYRGGRLDAALEWRDTERPSLTTAEEQFLAASAALRSSALDAERARAAGERRQNRRLRVALAATAVVLVIALVAAGAAGTFGRRARTAQDTAEVEAVTSGSLAAEGTNRAVAALLAAEAFRRWPDDPRTRSALLSVFTASPGFQGYVPVGAELGASGALLPDGRHAVVAINNARLSVMDLETGRRDDRFPDDHVPPMYDSQVVVSADGTTVAHLAFAPSPQDDCIEATQDDPMDRTTPFAADGSAPVCMTVATFDVATGAALMPRTNVPALTGAVAISPDGTTVAVLRRRDGAIALLDARDGHVLGALPGSREPLPVKRFLDADSGAIAFDSSGQLYVGSHDGPVRVLAPRTTTVARTLPVPPGAAGAFLAVSDDELIAVGALTATAVALDDGSTRWSATLRPPGIYTLSCPIAAVSWAQQRLLCSDYNGIVTESDLATGESTTVERDTQLGHTDGIAVSADGATLATFGQEISRWKLDGTGPVTRLVAAGQAPVGGFGPESTTLLVGVTPDVPDAPSHDQAVWDVDADRAIATPERPVNRLLWGSRETPVAFVSGFDGVFRVDMPSGHLVRLTAISGPANTLAPAGDRRMAVYQGGPSTIELVDPVADKVVGPQIPTSDYVFGMSASPDGSLLATEQVGDSGLFSDSHTRFYDPATGAQWPHSLTGWWWTVAGHDGLVVSSKGQDVSVLRPQSLTPVRSLATVPGVVKYLDVSDDGRTLVATSTDQVAALYDPTTGIRLGNLIDLPVRFDAHAYVSHDGTTLAVPGRDGVLLWNLAPADLAAAACRVAGRNLTASESATYLPSLSSSDDICPAA
ncbi:BTAD domain-containing putative transcriptional regulator [Cellulomonas sp. McL0617]|uniref:nSTAND1 domain-containing NTPase n=1 Tax=Cellulomonas sp. McL0617 TaxID=3415675 RepID=UPI003CF023FD